MRKDVQNWKQQITKMIRFDSSNVNKLNTGTLHMYIRYRWPEQGSDDRVKVYGTHSRYKNLR